MSDEMTDFERWQRAVARACHVANMAVETFSELHPDIRMNVGQWQHLKECIEREVRRAFCDEDISARDLLPKADNPGPLSPGV